MGWLRRDRPLAEQTRDELLAKAIALAEEQVRRSQEIIDNQREIQELAEVVKRQIEDANGG